MTGMNEEILEHAHNAALQHWQLPHPNFTSGRDPRTSDNALLVLLFGGLERASAQQWLNAGRRLIDKTYINILWAVQGLTAMRFTTGEQISAELDGFIRYRLAPVWDSLGKTPQVHRNRLATELLSHGADTLFGSLHSEIAASRLLFFLCPRLPFLPYSRGHLKALDLLAISGGNSDYGDYAKTCHDALDQVRPLLDRLPKPTAHYGNEREKVLIEEMLQTTDWWQRRIFDLALRQQSPLQNHKRDPLFGCDRVGGLL